MIFVYRKWDNFCKQLAEKGLISIPAIGIDSHAASYVVLKHDVETDVAKALKMAKIEQKYGHCGSYYVQAYLLGNPKNVMMLKEMADMGHEISYHYDVMDSCKGDIDKAIVAFDTNIKLFETNGFQIRTVCQHGNPIVDRIGYTSNRDFFRNEKVQKLYPNKADIMVDYKKKYETEYQYFSDAGRHFQLIYDPINNDRINSDAKNVLLKDTDVLLTALSTEVGNIISTHPHRWTQSAVIYVIKTLLFKLIKKVVKILVKIPFCKKIMSKYYYLAKKI